VGNVDVPRLRKIAGRYYWRPTPTVKALGFGNQALGSDRAAAITLAERWNAAVARALKNEPAEPVSGSVAAVIRDYLEGLDTSPLAAATKAGYRQTLAKIEEAWGAEPAAAINRQHLRKLVKSFADRPRQAKEYVKLWSIVLGHAVEIGLRLDNPALGMRVKGSPARQSLWMPDQVDAVCAAAVTAGRPSIALAVRLAYETTQRQADVLRMAWTALDGDVIRIRQSKTGRLVAVPISLALVAQIAAAPRTGVTMVISEQTQRPYKVFNFSHLFAEIRAAAGLPDTLWFRDLRRTGLTEAGNGGASVTELQALGGHKTIQQLGAYVVPSSDAARSASNKRVQYQNVKRTSEES
jgi:integrase